MLPPAERRRTARRAARPAAGTAARLGGLGRAHVDGEGHELAGQGQLDLLGDGVARLVLGLVRCWRRGAG